MGLRCDHKLRLLYDREQRSALCRVTAEQWIDGLSPPYFPFGLDADRLNRAVSFALSLNRKLWIDLRIASLHLLSLSAFPLAQSPNPAKMSP